MSGTQLSFLLVVTTILALGLFAAPVDERWDFDVTPAYTDADNPFAPEALRARLVRMAEHVEAITGDRIDTQRLTLRVERPAVAAERALEAAYPDLLDPRRPDFDSTAVTALQLGYWVLLHGYLGRYDAPGETLSVFPFAFELTTRGDPTDLLDVVLAHELAHVWQEQTFGLLDEIDPLEHAEADLAQTALLEGSAEFIAREVATKIGARDAFDQLAVVRGEDPKKHWGAQRRFISRRIRWAYGEGLDFVDRIHGRLGPMKTWKRLFEAPPSTVWAIEHPLAWLDDPTSTPPPLDAWRERLTWCLGDGPRTRPFFERWRHNAALREDLEARLEDTGLDPAAAPWSSLRGGLTLSGTPVQGALSDEGVTLRTWRFASPGAAAKAHGQLEAAYARIGLDAWSQGNAATALGNPRERVSAAGTRIRSVLTQLAAPLYPVELSWALRVEGALLLEALTAGKGVALALGEIVDLAAALWADPTPLDEARAGTSPSASPWATLVAARASPEAGFEVVAEGATTSLPLLRNHYFAHRLATAGGEEAVLAWLSKRPDDGGAWLAALSPPRRQDRRNSPEYGPLLVAALEHRDPDVARAALSALTGDRCRPRPATTRLPALVAAAAASSDAWMRCAALHAAEMLDEEAMLDPETLRGLARDPSPAVRTMLATCPALLDASPSEVRDALGRDEDENVRRAAQPDADADERPTALARRLMGDGLGIAASTDTEITPTAALRLLVDSMFATIEKQRQLELVRRVRRFLREGDEETRAIALAAVQYLREHIGKFIPKLTWGLTTADTRDSATAALVKGGGVGAGLDLRQARPRLLAMLEHPLWRSEVLRVLAANDVDLPPSVSSNVRAWMDAPDPVLRASAALLMLRLVPKSEPAAALLREIWSKVHTALRQEILASLVRHHADARVTQELRHRALTSPHRTERFAARATVKKGVLDEAMLEALLAAVPRMGRELAGECFGAFLDAADGLKSKDRRRARDLLTRHLNAWCDADHLPDLGGDILSRYDWPEFALVPEFVDALDRCLVRSDGKALRYTLALLRYPVENQPLPETPAVQGALNRIYALEDPPEDLYWHHASDWTSHLADRESLDAETLRGIFQRGAPLGYGGIEGLLEDNPKRLRDALACVPELLERNENACLEAALEIVEVAGHEAQFFIPQLTARKAELLPSWREEVDDAIAAIERDVQYERERDDAAAAAAEFWDDDK